MRMKKILVIGLLIMMISGQVFAADDAISSIAKVNGGSGSSTSANNYTFDSGYIKTIIRWVLGIGGGIVILTKGALNFIGALKNQQEDPNGVKNAIFRIIFSIAILVLAEIFIPIVGGAVGGWIGQIFNGGTISGTITNV